MNPKDNKAIHLNNKTTIYQQIAHLLPGNYRKLIFQATGVRTGTVYAILTGHCHDHHGVIDIALELIHRRIEKKKYHQKLIKELKNCIIMNPEKIPEFLKKYNSEFIGINGQLHEIKIEIIPYEEFSFETKLRLSNELKRDLTAHKTLLDNGYQESDERLEKFSLCRFGGMDEKPDMVGNESTPDFYNCGNRGKCSMEGKVCKNIVTQNGVISKREIDIIRATSKGLTDKEIADELFISIRYMQYPQYKKNHCTISTPNQKHISRKKRSPKFCSST